MDQLTRRETLQHGTGLLLPLLIGGILEGGSGTAAKATGLTMSCLALSGDGVLLAVPVTNKGVGLFEYATGKKSRTLDIPADALVTSLAFHGQGSRLAGLALGAGAPLLAAGGSDGVIRLWNTQTYESGGTIAAHKAEVTELLFTPDGKTLFSAGDSEKRFKMWDVASLKLINEVSADAVGVGALAISADGKTLAVGGSERIAHIHLYDVAELANTKRFSSYLRGGHSLSVTSLAFSPDGKRLVSGGMDNRVCLWDLAERKPLAVMTEHTQPVISVAYHPNGGSIASGSLDKTVRRWETPLGKALGVAGKHEGEVYAIQFAPDGKSLATNGQDGPTRVTFGPS